MTEVKPKFRRPTQHPLLMSASMMLATLRRLKTETRRLTGLDKINENPDGYLFTGFKWSVKDGSMWAAFGDTSIGDLGPPTWIKFPYGDVLDHLWLRENWRTKDMFDRVKPRDLPHDAEIFYEADEHVDEVGFGKLRPSIHMPQWASRGLVQMIEIRVERLHAICEAGAEMEGAQCGTFREGPNTLKGDVHLELNPHGRYVDGFKYLWITINGRLSWNDNPWVWVIRYKLAGSDRPAADN